jgi:hypothetical protein
MNNHLLHDLENDYKDTRHKLHTAAVEAAHARKQLIEAWVTLHYPAIACVATIMDGNLLSLDIAFPGTDKETSTRLAHEANEYLEGLLK